MGKKYAPENVWRHFPAQKLFLFLLFLFFSLAAMLVAGIAISAAAPTAAAAPAVPATVLGDENDRHGQQDKNHQQNDDTLHIHKKELLFVRQIRAAQARAESIATVYHKRRQKDRGICQPA